MEFNKKEISHEVGVAIDYCQHIITHGADMDIDDIQHHAEQIKRALMRVKKDVL